MFQGLLVSLTPKDQHPGLLVARPATPAAHGRIVRSLRLGRMWRSVWQRRGKGQPARREVKHPQSCVQEEEVTLNTETS